MRPCIQLPAILISLLFLAGLADVDDAMDKDRLEGMLKDRGELLVQQTFRRHPGKVLPFIDSYLEGGLKMAEEGGDAKAVMDSYKKGVRFAKIASKAFDAEIFTNYAASFASWSPQERLLFRKGQQEYRAGRKVEKDDPEQALTHYESSWQLAHPLNDSWGMAMAAVGQARAHKALGDNESSARWGRRRAQLYARLRLHNSAVDARLLVASCVKESANDLHAAWRLVHDRPESDEKRQQVYSAFLEVLEANGWKSYVEMVKRGENPRGLPPQRLPGG